jgi:phosphoglycolate phosphatase-like HAD superfamily hydrolase
MANELSRARKTEVQPFEGVVELLSLLQAKGRILSIFTARDLITAREVLSDTGLDVYFQHLISRDCVSMTKPSPEGIDKIITMTESSRTDVLMIGDNKIDIEAARAAKVKAISVCWGDAETDLSKISDHHFISVLDLHQWAETHLVHSSRVLHK